MKTRHLLFPGLDQSSHPRTTRRSCPRKAHLLSGLVRITAEEWRRWRGAEVPRRTKPGRAAKIATRGRRRLLLGRKMWGGRTRTPESTPRPPHSSSRPGEVSPSTGPTTGQAAAGKSTASSSSTRQHTPTTPGRLHCPGSTSFSQLYHLPISGCLLKLAPFQDLVATLALRDEATDTGEQVSSGGECGGATWLGGACPTSRRAPTSRRRRTRRGSGRRRRSRSAPR